MKKIFLSLFLFVLTMHAFAQDIDIENAITVSNTQIKWEESFEKAKKLALKKNKPIFVFFTGSDWCSPCRNLNADVLHTEAFYKLAASKFVFYEADIPRRTDIISPEKRTFNKELKQRLGVKGTPTILILNANEVEVARRSGYAMRDPELYFDFIQNALNQF